MGLWSFAEAASNLDCSPQNIYQKKGKLNSIGGIEVDTNGKEKINDVGFNYLQELRASTLKSKSTSDNKSNLNFNNDSNANTNNIELEQANYMIKILQEQVKDLKERVEEEKTQKVYWQNKYTNQNDELMTKIFPVLLATEEQNRQQEENTKKGLFGFFKNSSRH